MWKTIKGWTGMLIAIAYLIYYAVFYDVLKTQSAALQLQDSDALYAISSNVAMGNEVAFSLAFLAVIVLWYNVYKLYIKDSPFFDQFKD